MHPAEMLSKFTRVMVTSTKDTCGAQIALDGVIMEQLVKSTCMNGMY